MRSVFLSSVSSSFKKTHTQEVVGVKSDDRSALLYTRALPFSLSLRAPAKEEEEEEEEEGEGEEEAQIQKRKRRMSTRRARENDDDTGPSDPRKRSRAATTTTTTTTTDGTAPPPPVAVIPSTEALQSLLQSVNANKGTVATTTTTSTTPAAPGPPSILETQNGTSPHATTTTTTTTTTAPRDPRSRSSTRVAAAAAAAQQQQQQPVVMPQYGAAAPPPNVYGGTTATTIPGLHPTQRVPPPPPAAHQVVHTQQQPIYVQQPQTTTTTVAGAAPAGTIQYAYPPPPPGQTTTTTVLSMPPPPPGQMGTAATVPVSILRPGMILPANMPKELPVGHIIEQLPCPQENAGKVIGHGGEKINQLQQATKAIVKIQSSTDVPKGAPRLITIAGAPECVRHAIEQLLPVVNVTKASQGIPASQANAGAPQQQVLEIRIAVPDNMIGRVIGRGGETIKRISDESGARLQIERESNEVSAKGDASQLEIARMLIHDIVTAPVRQASAAGAAGASGEGKPEYVVIEIDSQGQEGRIIGRGGENIRSMAVTSGAKIQIDKETKMIKISGFKDKVETAKHMLETFMADYVPRDQQYQKSDTATTTTAAGTGAPVFGQTSEQQNAAAAHEAALKQEEEEKPLWETHQSPEGYTYYYNTTTGETQWEMPDDYDGFS